MKSDSTRTLGFLLHDAARLLRRRFEGRGAEHGLSAAQWRLMVHVVRHGCGVSQARLAEALEIEPISVSRLVDRMEQGGWVERSPDPQDRRVRLIHPTGARMRPLPRSRRWPTRFTRRRWPGWTRSSAQH